MDSFNEAEKTEYSEEEIQSKGQVKKDISMRSGGTVEPDSSRYIEADDVMNSIAQGNY